MKMKLNFGCGNTKKEGMINADIRPTKATDIIIGKTYLPFNDNSFDYILADNVLEHVEDLSITISEFYRICKNKAIIEVYVPHFNRPQFEYHRRLCRYNFLGVHCDYNTTSSYHIYFKCLERYLTLKDGYRFFEKIVNKKIGFYENSFLKSFIPASELFVKLEVKKLN